MCTLGTGAQHHRGGSWGHQGQLRSGAEWTDTPHSTPALHTDRGAGSAAVFDVNYRLSPRISTKPPHMDQFRCNLALNFPTQRGSDLSPWSNLSSGQPKTGGGCACGISCSWSAVCLCNPLSALQQQTQLRHCCSSGTGHFWPGFTGATTLLVPAMCPAPWECVRLCSDKGRREVCHCFSSNTLPMRREKFKKLTDLPC